MIDVQIVHGQWAFFTWDHTAHRRSYKQIRELEVRQDVFGWLTESGKQYSNMHSILLKMGAVIYAEDEGSYYFMKRCRNEITENPASACA